MTLVEAVEVCLQLDSRSRRVLILAWEAASSNLPEGWVLVVQHLGWEERHLQVVVEVLPALGVPCS